MAAVQQGSAVVGVCSKELCVLVRCIVALLERYMHCFSLLLSCEFFACIITKASQTKCEKIGVSFPCLVRCRHIRVEFRVQTRLLSLGAVVFGRTRNPVGFIGDARFPFLFLLVACFRACPTRTSRSRSARIDTCVLAWALPVSFHRQRTQPVFRSCR